MSEAQDNTLLVAVMCPMLPMAGKQVGCDVWSDVVDRASDIEIIGTLRTAVVSVNLCLPFRVIDGSTVDEVRDLRECQMSSIVGASVSMSWNECLKTLPEDSRGRVNGDWRTNGSEPSFDDNGC